jgi:hypothetical protein
MSVPMKPAGAPPQRSRRRFLRLGLAGAAALAVGGIFAWQTTGYEVPVDTERRLRALSPKEYLIVAALAARILRTDARDLPTSAELDVALFIDGMVARLDAANRRDFSSLLQLLEHAMPRGSGHASRFTRLDGDAQDAVLSAMMTSSVGLVRGAFEALKSLCVMGYFRDARTWAALGYDGPTLGRPARGWAAEARARERSR